MCRQFKLYLPRLLHYMHIQAQKSQINEQELKIFLTSLVLGNPELSWEQLNNQQQQEMLNQLQRLHDKRGLKAKCIWSIMSLYLSRGQKPGIFYMSSYKNIKFSEEIFTKKKFIATLNQIDDPNPTYAEVKQILEVLDLDQSFFIKQFRKWQNKQQQIQHQMHAGLWQWTNRFNDQNQHILENGQFDSDPETVFYRDIMDAFSQDQYDRFHKNFSCAQINVQDSQISHQHEERSENWDNEETISLKRLIKMNTNQTNYTRQNNTSRKKKYGKRPKNSNKKRNKLFNFSRKIKEKQVSFKTYINRQKQILIKNEKKLNNLTPKKRVNRIQNHKKGQLHFASAKNKIKRPNRKKNIKNSAYVQNLFSEEYSDLQYHSESQQQSQKYSSHNDEKSQNSKQHIFKGNIFRNSIVPSRHVRNNNIQNNVMDIQHFSQNQPALQSDNKTHTIEIPYIEFTPMIRSLKYIQIPQSNNLFAAIRPKEIFKQIRQLINSNKKMLPGQHSLQIITRAFCMRNSNIFQDYVKGYIDPIIENQLYKNLSLIVCMVMQELYKNLGSQNQVQIRQKAEIFHQLFDKCNPPQKNILSNFIQNILKNIIQEVTMPSTNNSQMQSQHTESMVAFTNSFRKNIQRIHIPAEKQIQSVCLAVIIVDIGLFSSILPQTDRRQIYNSALNACFQTNISNKAQFVGKISQIYEVYDVNLTQKIRNNIFGLALYINLQNRPPRQFLKFLIHFDRMYIENKLKNEQRPNPNVMLSRVLLPPQEFKNKFQKINKNNTGIQIYLNKYHLIFQYDIFKSNDKPIQNMINKIKQYDYANSFDQSILCSIGQLLIKVYKRKMSIDYSKYIAQKIDKKVNKTNNTPIIQQIHQQMIRYIKDICHKYRSLLQRTENQSIFKTDRLESCERLIQNFIQKFVECPQFSYSIQHYFFSLYTIAEYMMHIGETKNQPRLYKETIVKSFIQKIYEFGGLLKQKIFIKQNADEIDDEEIFQMMTAKRKLQTYFIQVLSSLSLEKYINKKLFSFEQIQVYKDKKYFQLQGVLMGIRYYDQNDTAEQVKNCFKLIQKIRQQASSKKDLSGLFHSNYQALLEFLKGFLKSSYSISPSKANSKLQVYANVILQILFISLGVSQKENRQAKFLYTIFKYHQFSCFRNSSHFMSMFIKQSNDVPSVQQIYTFSKNKCRNDQFLTKIKQSLKESIHIWLNFNKLYHQKGWRHKKIYLSKILLQTLIFVSKINDSHELVNMLKPYFVLKDSSLQNNTISLLKSVQIKDDASIIVSFFSQIISGNPRLMDLSSTIDSYLQYIVNEQVANMKQEFQSVKIESILKEVNRQEINESEVEAIKEICKKIFIFLLQKLKYHQKPLLNYFFSLFKNQNHFKYHKFYNTLFIVFVTFSKEIQNIMNQNKISREYASIQEVLNNFILRKIENYHVICQYLRQRLDRLIQRRQVPERINYLIQNVHKVVESRKQNYSNSQFNSLIQKLRLLSVEAQQVRKKFKIQSFKKYIAE